MISPTVTTPYSRVCATPLRSAPPAAVDSVSLGTTPSRPSWKALAWLGLAVAAVPLLAQAAPQPPAQTSARSQASGSVGHNGVGVTITQSGSDVEAIGGVGWTNVHLFEADSKPSHAHIWGNVAGTNSGDVDVDVTSLPDGSKQYDGWVGSDNLHVRESSKPDGSRWLFGSMGDKTVNVTRTASDQGIRFQGYAESSWGQYYGFVNVNVQPATAPKTDVVVPLLGLTRTADVPVPSQSYE